MGDFRQWIGMVEELRQLTRTKERIDHGGSGSGVDQVNWGKYLVIAHVHSVPDSSSHTGKSDSKLAIKLFANRTNPSVAQVIDVIQLSLLVDQADEIFHNLDHIFFRKHQGMHRNIQVQLSIDLISTHFSQIVTLIGKEHLFDNTAGGFFIRWIGATQLTINIGHSLHFGAGGVFLQSVEDNAVIFLNIFALKHHYFHLGLQNRFDMFFLEDNISFENDLVSFNRNYLPCIFIHEVLGPGFENPG